MAADLARLLDRLDLEQVTLIGHSMGAKVAMWHALHAPERVDRLVAVDMAPTAYPNRLQRIWAALESLPVEDITSRAEADAFLARSVDSPAVRQYLLQNLESREGRWSWRMNLAGLLRHVPELMGFPEPSPGRQFTGPALFLYGGSSDYVMPEHEAPIRRLFPYARCRVVPGAGHWVYADRPKAFLAALDAFLASGSQ
jgi:esterase